MKKEEWIRERLKKLEAKEHALADGEWLRHGYSLIAAQNELHLILE